jgi:LysM repeat protein
LLGLLGVVWAGRKKIGALTQAAIEPHCRIGYSRAMTTWVWRFGCALLVLAGLALGGCLPSAQSQLEEEKEPHFLTGMGLVNAMDYSGAIESFEKSLDVNPQSASAHFQLGWLYEQKEPNPAIAIYHYDRYLRLRPGAENADIVKQRIEGCMQQIARKVSLGPVTEKVQHDLEQMAEDKKRLVEQNKQLADEVAKWRAYYNSQATLTNRAGQLPRPIQSTGQIPPPGGLNTSNLSSTAAPPGAGMPRSHKVSGGETMASIAKQYGVRLDALMQANPKVEPRRMKAGLILNVPPPPP